MSEVDLVQVVMHQVVYERFLFWLRAHSLEPFDMPDDAGLRTVGVRPLPAPTTPDHPVSPAHGDPGRHSEGQER